MVNSSRRQSYAREIHTRTDVVQSRASDDPPNGGARAAAKGDATAVNRRAAHDHDRMQARSVRGHYDRGAATAVSRALRIRLLELVAWVEMEPRG